MKVHHKNTEHLKNVAVVERMHMRDIVSLPDHIQHMTKVRKESPPLKGIPDIIVVHYLHFLIAQHIAQKQLAPHIALFTRMVKMTSASTIRLSRTGQTGTNSSA